MMRSHPTAFVNSLLRIVKCGRVILSGWSDTNVKGISFAFLILNYSRIEETNRLGDAQKGLCLISGSGDYYGMRDRGHRITLETRFEDLCLRFFRRKVPNSSFRLNYFLP